MGNNLNKLLLRQIKKHFGSAENVPEGLNNFLKDINNTYESFEEDTLLLQNSIEISSLELREAFQKHKQDAESQKLTINKIKEAISALNPDQPNLSEGKQATSESTSLFESLIRLIEERKKAEEEILKLSKAVEQNPASIVITNTDGDIEYVNTKFCTLTGYEKQEIIGKNPRILKSENSPYELFIGLWDTILSGREWHGDLQNKKKNGELYWESALISPIINDHGQITHFIAIKEDITERKHAEEERIRQTGLITSLLDSIPDIIFFKDTEGIYLGCNPPFAEFVGKPKNEIVGKSDFDIFNKETADAFRFYDNAMLNEKLPRHNEEWITYPEGKRILIDTLKTPYWASDGSLIGILGISRDITKRKEAEEALQQISTRLSLAARAGGVGVWDMDLVNDFLLWDDQMFALYGVDRRYEGQANDTMLSGIHPDDTLQVDKQIELAINGEKEFDTEFRVIWPDGSIHNIRALATVQRDNEGVPLHVIGTNWDITEQKNTEATLLIAIQESDSANKAKSEFLANMSHEIRTPLNGVIGFTDLLLRTPLNKIQQQYAKNANTSGHSLLGIINDILDFSKIEAGKMELDWIKADIIELVELTSDIIKYHASQKSIELLLNIQQDIPRFVVMDPTRLKQILVNLLANAVKFTEKGEVELKVTFIKTDDHTGEFRFSVRDTGIGINADQQKLLFKAFSQADGSTTRKFGGTGLGLTISNMLAEKMGSKIEVVSAIGEGSTFFFTLKTNYEDGEKLDLNDLSSMKRLLVIDDNYNNRLILEHACQNWGIDFVGIDTGFSAIKLLEASQEPFDVIIVDYQMPEINGIDTIRMIREQLNLTPEKQPVILLHSSSDDIEIYEECKKLGVIFNLTKPVKSSELLQYLKNVNNHQNIIVPEREDIPFSKPFHPSVKATPGILVAEDVLINMILVTTLIKQMIPNVIIYEAKNGSEAYEMTITKKPDLIIMDIQMPIMSGIEATMAIRSYESGKGSRVPIVALTAGAVKGEKEKCLEAGMDDFLTKPLESNRLHEILGKHLSYFYRQTKLEKGEIAGNKANLHFDRALLMESIGNDKDIFDELLEAIYLQFNNDLKILKKAINGQDLVMIKKTAHSIKGASLNMWFSQMAELAIELELNLDKGDFGELNGLFNDLALEWEHVQSLLKDL